MDCMICFNENNENEIFKCPVVNCNKLIYDCVIKLINTKKYS